MSGKDEMNGVLRVVDRVTTVDYLRATYKQLYKQLFVYLLISLTYSLTSQTKVVSVVRDTRQKPNPLRRTSVKGFQTGT